MTALAESDLLVGSSSGLKLLQSSRSGEWRTRSLIDVEWITSITEDDSADGRYLVTTRTGAIYIWDRSARSAERISQLDAHLWFCHRLSNGDLLAGGKPALLLTSGDDGGTWAPVDAITRIELAGKWSGHTQPRAHINSVLAPAHRPGELFIAVEVGGVIRTRDLGGHWTDVTQQVDRDVHCVVMDDCNGSQHIYAGTGTGVFESPDLGDSWKHLGPSGDYVQAVAVDAPRRRIVASTADRPFGRKNSGIYSGISAEINFAVKVFDLDERRWGQSIATSPAPSGILSKALSIVASSGQVVAGDVGGSLFLSDGSLGNWERLASGLGIVECVTTVTSS